VWQPHPTGALCSSAEDAHFHQRALDHQRPVGQPGSPSHASQCAVAWSLCPRLALLPVLVRSPHLHLFIGQSFLNGLFLLFA
jgi:hypothetical protein